MYTHTKFAQLLHVNLNTLDNYIHIYWRNNHTKCTFTSVQIELTYARASSKYTDGFFGSLVLHSSNQPFNAKIYNIPEHYKTVTRDWHSAGKYRKKNFAPCGTDGRLLLRGCQLFVTLALTLDRVIWRTVVRHSYTCIYIPNFIEIGKMFFFWMD